MHRARLVLLAAVASVACSEERFTQDTAAKLIQGLDAFKREARITIQTGAPLQSAFKCDTLADVDRDPANRFALSRGWVRLEAQEATLGFGSKASCPALTLTSVGEAASATWTKGNLATGQGTAWGIPIAQRDFLQVTELTTAPDGSARVEFQWRWAPNETGTALQQSLPTAKALFEQRRQGRASCRRGGDGWNCQMGMWATPSDVGELRP